MITDATAAPVPHVDGGWIGEDSYILGGGGVGGGVGGGGGGGTEGGGGGHAEGRKEEDGWMDGCTCLVLRDKSRAQPAKVHARRGDGKGGREE